MDILIKGMESKGTISILIGFAGILSEDKIKAAYMHYVDGINEAYCADFLDIDAGNLNKALKSIEECAKQIDRYNVLRIKPKKRSTCHDGDK